MQPNTHLRKSDVRIVTKYNIPVHEKKQNCNQHLRKQNKTTLQQNVYCACKLAWLLTKAVCALPAFQYYGMHVNYSGMHAELTKA
jgi:hypothetical protein